LMCRLAGITGRGLTPSQKHRIVILTALRHAGRDDPIGGGPMDEKGCRGVGRVALFRRGRWAPSARFSPAGSRGLKNREIGGETPGGKLAVLII